MLLMLYLKCLTMPKLETIVDYTSSFWPYKHSTMIPGFYNFYGSDSQELYARNLRTRDQFWIYREKLINYNFNEQGLRMKKNINEVNSNYIYFSGTSFSMGIGIDETDRFSELVSSETSLDMINYSGPTYTIKIQIISFFNFLKKYPKPKILVIEYPPSFAYTFIENDSAIMYYSKYIPNTNYKILYEEMLKTDFFENESEIYRNMLKTLCKESNIKLIELSFHPSDVFSTHDGIISIDPDIIDSSDINNRFGRDIVIGESFLRGHPGVGVHRLAYEKIIKEI